ncbi:MAG TPA: phosphoribosylanthranilate isomerase [Chryseosolibacter sp.]
MNIRMKVCGMREPGNILEVSQLHPEYMGFIFYTGTPRYVGPDFKVPDEFPAFIKRVGVFVNETTANIIAKAEEHRLDFVQLHGGESVRQCHELRTHGVGVIKVFSIDENMDFTVTRDYRDEVDFFLFDTKGRFYGGNAISFDWGLLERYDQSVPFFISGGITPQNAERVKMLKDFNLQAIDLNSGVEVTPALKDVAKIKAIRLILNSKE